jgi:phosphohistidine phosphatase
MDIILWRHAEAFELAPDKISGETNEHDDLDRALTAKGERQAHRMAEWLNQRLAHSTRILVSPARRAQQTAKALDRTFKTVEALSPSGSAEDLIRAARWPEGNEPVLIVGHQPTLGLAAAILLSGQAQAWAVKKGAVWWLRHRQRNVVDDGSGQVVLQVVQGPDFL